MTNPKPQLSPLQKKQMLVFADAIGLINTFLLGESLANPTLAGVALGRKIIQTTAGATKGAQVVKNLPKSGAVGSAIRSGVGSLIGKATK